MDTKEWARNGSFMKKPTTGWLHDDAALQEGDGVYYPVRYVGSMPVDKSMRTLRFDDRTDVTREAIWLVCESAGIRRPERRQVSRLVKTCLSGDPQPIMANVKLTISTTGIALVVVETNQVIANHIMPNISFATGCDAVDYDILGYVAKDHRNIRECHVFDCGHMAPDVMATIGQAFELRYKAFLAKGASRNQFGALPPTPGQQMYGDVPYDRAQAYGDVGTYGEMGSFGGVQSYGDVPYNKAEPSYGDVEYQAAENPYGEAPGYAEPPNVGGEPTYGEIDDTGYTRNTVIYDNGPSTSSRPRAPGGQEAIYESAEDVGAGKASVNFDTRGYDRAGRGDYDDVLALNTQDSDLVPAPGGAELERPLHEEPWFHGKVARDTADQVLSREGDFIVRENISSPGQFILSCLSGGQCKHLLLVDPSGRVRTKDMSFNSVSHLINYHLRAHLPIVSPNSRITLGQPVARQAGAGHAYNQLPPH